MRSILEELFYGNICPNTDCRSSNAQTKELMGYIADHHDTLAKSLNEQQKEILGKFDDCYMDGFSSIRGITVNRPKGAFYLFPSIQGTGMDSTTFCNRLLDEARVVCVPGNAFGACGEGYIRVSYSGQTDSVIEAIDRIRRFCNSL